MELKWLEDLLALLDERSLTRGADRRHVTQPAYARRIRQLEHWLGAEIIDRRTKPVSIRANGLAMEEEVRDLVNRLYGLRNRVHDSDDRFTIVAQHTLAISHFPALIRQVKAVMPDVSYRVVTANYGECESVFRAGADFLLCYQTSQRQFDYRHGVPVTRISIGEERLIPVASKYLASQIGEMSPGKTLPMLMYQPGGFLAEALAGSCLLNVIRDYRVDLICESALSASLKEMVLADMGIAWLAAKTVSRELSSGEMVSFESELGSTELMIMLYYRDRSRSGLVGNVIANFVESGR